MVGAPLGRIAFKTSIFCTEINIHIDKNTHHCNLLNLAFQGALFSLKINSHSLGNLGFIVYDEAERPCYKPAEYSKETNTSCFF